MGEKTYILDPINANVNSRDQMKQSKTSLIVAGALNTTDRLYPERLCRHSFIKGLPALILVEDGLDQILELRKHHLSIQALFKRDHWSY